MTSGGQGGMIISKDQSLIDSIRDYTDFDCRQDKNDRFNFQMTELQAAIGQVQLQRLNSFLQKRNMIFDAYKQAGLSLLDTMENGVSPVRFRSILKTNYQQACIKVLNDHQISSIVPIESWELLDDQVYPNALACCSTFVSLPCYPDLSLDSVDKIVRVLKDYA